MLRISRDSKKEIVSLGVHLLGYKSGTVALPGTTSTTYNNTGILVKPPLSVETLLFFDEMFPLSQLPFSSG